MPENVTGEEELIQVPGHIPMASRVPLQSWGTGSGPSLPDIDSDLEVRKDR